MSQRHPGRRIRNFLVDREYQLHYALHMVAVSAGLTALLGFWIYKFNAEASRLVNLRALDPTDETAQFLVHEYATQGRLLLVVLVAFGVLLSMVLAAWQIVTTHKVAGPLYYIAHQVKRIRDGYLGTLHPLRKGDLLHGFFENFREMHQALRERTAREAELFARLAVEAEQAGQGKIADQLRVLQRQREDSLQ
jgi:hypothetical protein